jgi:hypothetical protein
VSNSIPPYDASDIQRYLNGEMSNSEMHQLELAALQNPFLQDAIDGYREAFLEGRMKELLPIQAAAENYEPPLIRKYHQAPIPLWRRKLVQVAVAASIIGGTGWYIYNLSQPQKADIARKEKAPANTAIVTDTAVDTGIIPPNTVAVQEAPVKKEKTTVTTDRRKNETAEKPREVTRITAATTPVEQRKAAETLSLPEDDVVQNKLAEQKSEPAARTAQAYNPRISSLRQDSVAFNSLPFARSGTASGKVVDKEIYPLDNISLQVKGTQSAVVSDELGRFQITVPDTGATLVASGPGFTTKEFKALPGKKLELELSPAAPSLEEVVVMGYSARKKRKQTGAIEPEMDTTEAAPTGGWKNFEAYVLNNKQLNRKGKSPVAVVLSFEVDAKGRPAEFDIIESGGTSFDNEAIRLLKAGPDWINKTKGTSPMAKITIIF